MENKEKSRTDAGQEEVPFFIEDYKTGDGLGIPFLTTSVGVIGVNAFCGDFNNIYRNSLGRETPRPTYDTMAQAPCYYRNYRFSDGEQTLMQTGCGLIGLMLGVAAFWALYKHPRRNFRGHIKPKIEQN